MPGADVRSPTVRREAPDRRAAALVAPVACALLAWGAFAALMMYLPQLRGESPPPWGVLIARTGKLAVYSKEFFLGPLVLLVALGWLGRFVGRERSLGHALTDGLRFGAMAFGASAVLWIALAAWSSLEGNDPWENLPGIVPPYLEAFLARHPGMETTTYGGTHQLRLHDGQGHSVFVDGDDLKNAAARFEPCAPGDSDPAALGGIPPYPGGACDTLLRIRRGEVERVMHVFVVARDDHERIRQHFERWADTLGAEHGYSGGPNHYFFKASKDGRQWDLRVFVGRSRATEIYIARGGHTREWPGEVAK